MRRHLGEGVRNKSQYTEKGVFCLERITPRKPRREIKAVLAQWGIRRICPTSGTNTRAGMPREQPILYGLCLTICPLEGTTRGRIYCGITTLPFTTR